MLERGYMRYVASFFYQFLKIIVQFFFTTRNQRLLVFLLPKAAKGTKNALVAHPACDPLQAHGLNGKIVLSDAFRFTPLSPDGYPALRTNATGQNHDRAG